METLIEPAKLPADLNEDGRVKSALALATEALDALHALQEQRKALAASMPRLEQEHGAARVSESLREPFDKGAATRLEKARAELADVSERIPVQEKVLQEYRRRLDQAYDQAARDVQALASAEAARLQGELLAVIEAAAAKNLELYELYRWRLRFSAVTDRQIQFGRPVIIMNDLLPNETNKERGTAIGYYVRSLESAGIAPGDLKKYR